MQLDNRTLDTLVRTIIGEAGNESPEGKAAVAHVLFNRARDKRYPNDPAAVAKQPMQFSAWNTDGSGNSLPHKARPDDPVYQEISQIVQQVAQGQIPDNTGGATHYYSPAGMEALKAKGYQSNLTPGWFEQETKARGEDPVTIGGHIFTGRSSGYKSQARTQDNVVPPTPKVTTQYLDSNNNAVSEEDARLLNDVAGVLGKEKEFGLPDPNQEDPLANAPDIMNSPAFIDPDATSGPVLSTNGSGPPTPQAAQMNEAVLSSDNVKEEDKNIWQRFMQSDKWTVDSHDAMLAIGAGLLSGDNWNEGFANASKNVLGLRQQDKEADHQEQLLEMRQENAQASQSSPYNRPYNVVGRDKKTGREVVLSGTRINGRDYIPGPNGEMVLATDVLDDVRAGGRTESQDVTSGANGIPNATYVNKNGTPAFKFQREGEAKLYQYSRRAISANRDINQIVEKFGPEALTSIQAGLEQWGAQNARQSITGAVINSILNDAGIQGPARSAMSQYLQAVLRADTGAAYTGVEMADYAGAFLPNTGDSPETVAYKANKRQESIRALVAGTGSAAPYLLGVLDGTYELGGEQFQFEAPSQGGALDSSNTEDDKLISDTDKLLTELGV